MKNKLIAYALRVRVEEGAENLWVTKNGLRRGRRHCGFHYLHEAEHYQSVWEKKGFPSDLVKLGLREVPEGEEREYREAAEALEDRRPLTFDEVLDVVGITVVSLRRRMERGTIQHIHMEQDGRLVVGFRPIEILRVYPKVYKRLTEFFGIPVRS